MDVHAGARQLLVPLGHEADRSALRVRDLFGGVLVDDVAVGLGQNVAVLEVYLLLSGSPFALAELDRDAAVVERIADCADQALFLGALKDVIVLDVAAHGLQLVVALAASRVEAVVEDVKLDLRAAHDGESRGGGSLQLALQDAARRDLDRSIPGLGEEIAYHQGGLGEPGGAPERREVRYRMEIAVAAFPTREAVARHGVHLHVAGEQVVASVVAVTDRVLHEEMAGDALAHQAAIHVGEDGENGFDLAGFDGRA